MGSVLLLIFPLVHNGCFPVLEVVPRALWVEYWTLHIAFINFSHFKSGMTARWLQGSTYPGCFSLYICHSTRLVVLRSAFRGLDF